jgi:hypothetical protein
MKPRFYMDLLICLMKFGIPSSGKIGQFGFSRAEVQE